MPTSYPTSLDTLANPSGSNTLASPSHAGQHADANDAIEALESQVGILDGSKTISAAPTAGIHAFRKETFTVSGAATIGQPTTGYLYTPEAIPYLVDWFSSAGHNEATASNVGRTGNPAFRVNGSSSGLGDFVAYNAAMSVSGTKASSTHFLANPAAVIINGTATALATGVYLNVSELNATDGGFDCAAIGAVYNMTRTVGTGAKYATWQGVRVSSGGSQDADAGFVVVGKWKVGLDLTPAVLSANNAAVALKANDRVYLNASSTADPLSAKWYADTLGAIYMGYESGDTRVHVVGSGIQVDTASSGTPAIIDLVNSASSGVAEVRISGETSGGTAITARLTVNTGGSINFGTYSNHALLFFANSAERARVTGTELQMAESINFKVGTTTGTKIGTATTEKLGFWNATPVVQSTAVADASGGAIIDAEARTALNALLSRLRTIGIIAT